MDNKILYAKCRGTMVEFLSSYLSRIDKFRTEYELTDDPNFVLKDCSPFEFNAYISYLRDTPYDKNNVIPKELKYVYNYLNTDCEVMNKEREEENENKFLTDIKTKMDDPSEFNIFEELNNDPSMGFSKRLELNENQYSLYKNDVDEIIKNRKWIKEIDNYIIIHCDCKKHSRIYVHAKNFHVHKSVISKLAKCNVC